MEEHYFGLLPEGDSRRAAVQDFFAGGGFPTSALEDWRFSDLDGLKKTAWQRPVVRPGEAPSWTNDFESRVLLADGALEVAGAPANGLDFGAASSEAWEDSSSRNPLEALNAGLFDCGFRVRLEKGREAGPILLYSRRSGGDTAMLHPRSVVELGPGSSLTVIEAHDGHAEDPGWTNPTTLCRVGEDAHLRYVRVDLETGKMSHTGRVTFRLERNARVHSTVLSLTGGVSRTDTAAVLAAEGAEIDLEGLFLGVGAAKADQHTLAIHAARHTASRQLFKNVLTDEASAVFDGKVLVENGAIGTDASQSNRNLLLSKKAQIHTRPRLEINADDVTCAHGAAIGKLDEDALFYLRSRGLGRMDSREILVRGFAGEVVEKIPAETIRTLAAQGLQRVRASASFGTA